MTAKKPPFNGTVFSQPLAAHLPSADTIKWLQSQEPKSDETRMLNWDASPEEWTIARQIVTRAVDIAQSIGLPPASIKADLILADIICCHLNACPLHLLRLLMASQDDFSHDVFGIGVHLHRGVGVLLHGFKPRLASV